MKLPSFCKDQFLQADNKSALKIPNANELKFNKSAPQLENRSRTLKDKTESNIDWM